jgi:hypothetical protein
MGDRRSACRVLMGKPERENHLEYLGIDRKIILKFIIKTSFRRAWTGFSWPRIGKSSGMF